MINTKCAICGTKNNSTELYKQNFSLNEINETIFSARRLPDKIHYKIVRCKTCGLVRSDPIITSNQIEIFYKKSNFNYREELINITETYLNYLKKALKYINAKNSLLEIGCGNGFFLEESLKLGFRNVYGIEPSKDAIDKANSNIKKNILNGVFKPNLFKKNSFDIICMFQVFDHLEKPNEILQECRKILKKNGVILAINHDVRSSFSTILKDSCPIIDIEHIYLYDKKTTKLIYEKNNFKVMEIFDVKNKYSLSYWMKLIPMPKRLKKSTQNLINCIGLGKIILRIRAGNLGIISIK